MQPKPALPTILSGRYRLDAILGAGGMATVYLGRDLALDRPVALKLLHPTLVHDHALLGRFLREARSAARVSSHPNIVTVFDVGQDGDTPFIVMEYVAGETLRERLLRTGPLDEGEAVNVARQVASALDHAHSVGLVHRDVKPQNILLAPDGTAKLADFGIALGSATTRLTTVGTVLGSAAYMSPEQARGEAGQPASDLYSLGAVMFEMLAGRPPFIGDTAATVAAQHSLLTPPPLASLRPGVSPGLTRLVGQLLEKDPAARPASADEVVRRLAAAQAETTISAPVGTRPDGRTGTRTGRRAAESVVLAGALCALVLGAFRAIAPGAGRTVPPSTVTRQHLEVTKRGSPSPTPTVTVAPTATPVPAPTASPQLAPAAPPAPRPAHGPAHGHGRGPKRRFVSPLPPPVPKHDHGQRRRHDEHPGGENGAGDQGNDGNN